MTTTELNTVEFAVYEATMEYLNSNPTLRALSSEEKKHGVTHEIVFEWTAKDVAKTTAIKVLQRRLEDDSWVNVSNCATAGFCAAWDELFPIVDKQNNRDFSKAKFQTA